MTSAIAAGPPRHASDRLFELGDEEVRRFNEEGFLVLERITSDEEVAWLGDVWDELFADRRTWFDVASPFGAKDDVRVGQLLFPEKHAPSLRETLYFRNARRIAARLLAHEETALEAWGHMVLKPALRGLATPLHQDESYWEPAFDYHAVGAWLPLEDVDGDNGCMCFVPGSHRGDVLPHRHLDDDPRLHLLEVDVAHDTRSMVAVPLRVGGATFHHPRTLHATAANRSARPRRAFANEFQTQPRRRAVPAAKPWLDDQKRVWTEHKSAGTPARPAKE
jgi:ectoine hydroxylase-related dioxygenase (phytanoyl-CoA dioxygenase family)